MNVKNLEAYIEKVIQDACTSEERPNDVRYEYKIIDGHFLLALQSKYIRVRRRIEFRLGKNLKKNFGLKYNLVLPFSDCRGSFSENAVFDLYPMSSSIDPHHSFAEWTVFGKKYTITSVYGNWNDLNGESPLSHLNLLKEHGFDRNECKDWEQFKAAFEAAYGETPEASMLKVKHEYEKRKGCAVGQGEDAGTT